MESLKVRYLPFKIVIYKDLDRQSIHTFQDAHCKDDSGRFKE